MLISEPLPFVRAYLDVLDEQLRRYHGRSRGLSRIQRHWLGFCLMSMMVTESLCWARSERASGGRYSARALTWMFRLRQAALERVITRQRDGSAGPLRDPGGGVLVADNPRAKVAQLYWLCP